MCLIGIVTRLDPYRENVTNTWANKKERIYNTICQQNRMKTTSYFSNQFKALTDFLHPSDISNNNYDEKLSLLSFGKNFFLTSIIGHKKRQFQNKSTSTSR